LDIFVMFLSIAGLFAFVIFHGRWSDSREAKENVRLKARLRELETPPEVVFIEIENSDSKFSRFFQQIKKTAITSLAVPKSSSTITQFKNELISLQGIGVRFAFLNCKNRRDWRAWLMRGDELIAPVMDGQEHRRLCKTISEGKACLIDRIELDVKGPGETLAKIFLAPEPEIHNGCVISRVIQSNSSDWIRRENPEILWTGKDEEGRYIIRHTTETFDNTLLPNTRMIIVMSETEAKVNMISPEIWSSAGWYRILKRCDQNQKVRQKCLDLYNKHRDQVFLQIKDFFAAANPKLCKETGFPFMMDETFDTIWEESASDYMKNNCSEKPHYKRAFKSKATREYCNYIDQCGNIRRRPKSFSRFCLEYHWLTVTEETDEAYFVDSGPYLNEDELQMLDYNEIMSDPLDDRPLNRF